MQDLLGFCEMAPGDPLKMSYHDNGLVCRQQSMIEIASLLQMVCAFSDEYLSRGLAGVRDKSEV
jgi:hypothetical protein